MIGWKTDLENVRTPNIIYLRLHLNTISSKMC